MKRILALVMTLVMLLALCACSSTENSAKTSDKASESSETPAAADGKRVLRVGTTDTACDYYPTSGGGIQKHMVYEGIYQIGDGKYEPWLIESFTWVDETTAELVLRDGVTFSNSDPLEAEDILYSLRLAATASGSVFASTFSKIDFDRCTVSDDGKTVTLVLKEAYGPFESVLFCCYVVDKSATENLASDEPGWWDTTVATGPYEVVENVDGSHVTFGLREDYWDKEHMPDWDEITLNFYSNATAMFIAFENGEIDLALGVDANDAARLESGDVSHPDTTSYGICHANANYFFAMSPYKEEFQDVKVREAIAHVLNGDDIGSVQFGILYDADIDSTLPSSVRYYAPQGKYETDVEYARQCMAESAYPDGFECNVVAISSDSGMWEVIQAELAQLNISVNITFYDMLTCMPLWMNEGGTDIQTITVNGGNSSLDPNESFQMICDDGMLAACRILDEDYNELYYRAAGTTNSEKRAEAYSEMQKWLYDNFQIIPLFQPDYCYCWNNTVLTADGLPSVTKSYLQFATHSVD